MHPNDEPDHGAAAAPDDERATAEEGAVRDLLARQPDPGPMPVALEQRIGAALQQAGEVRATDRGLLAELGMVAVPVDEPPGDIIHFERVAPQRTSSGDPGGEPGTELDTVTRRRWPLLAAAAAGIVAVGAVGALALGELRSGSDGLAAIPGSQASPGPAPTVSVATSVNGRLHVQASGAAYTTETLASGARALLDAPGPAASSDPSAGPLATTDGANACVAALGDADAPSVTLDLATFDGQPAAIVVIARPDKTTAYAVQRDCSTGDPKVLKDAVPVP